LQNSFLKVFMKFIYIILIAFLFTACAEKNSTSNADKIVGQTIEGTYVASDKTAVTIKDGLIKMEAHGVFPARSAMYKIVNKRVEFTFDAPSYFQIKEDGKLVYQGLVEYSKK
jgi:hypothetical protein